MTTQPNIEEIMNEIETKNNITNNEKEESSSFTLENLKTFKKESYVEIEKSKEQLSKLYKLEFYSNKKMVCLEDIMYLKECNFIDKKLPNASFSMSVSSSGVDKLHKQIAIEEEVTKNSLMSLFNSNIKMMTDFISKYNSDIDNYKNLVNTLAIMSDKFNETVTSYSNVKYTKTRLNGRYINLLTYPLNMISVDKLEYEVEVNPVFQESMIKIKEVFDNPCFKQLIQSDEIKESCGITDIVSLLDVMKYYTSSRANSHVSDLKNKLDAIHSNFIELMANTNSGTTDITFYEVTYKKIEELYNKALSYISYIQNIITLITPITIVITDFNKLNDE